MVVLWKLFIFIMSSQTGAESGNTSSGLINTACSIIIPDFSELEETQKIEIISKISYPVRKLAHFTEYFILAAVINLSVIQTKRKISLTLSNLAISFALGVLYAITDEIHQLFVPGRAGTITDVLIDSAGVALGCITFAIIYEVIKKRKK